MSRMLGVLERSAVWRMVREFACIRSVALAITVCCALSVAVLSGEYESAKSVILMIGDGMGTGQIEAARWSLVGEDGLLAMDHLAVQDGWSRTSDIDGSVTDSAAAATAMATRNGRLSVDLSSGSLVTILEMAKLRGKSVGLVTTVPLVHATPAAFAAHAPNRDKFLAIAVQLIEAGVDVLFGGGAQYLLQFRETCECGWSGWRADRRDLVAEAQFSGYTFICDEEGLTALDASSVDRVLGVFANAEMLRPLVPTLAEMTTAAIDILSRDPDGFFLMIEGGLIDWVCHYNQADAAIELTIGFDHAVDVVLDYVRDASDTLLIVTADHETGGMQVYQDEQSTFREDGPFETPSGSSFYVNWLHTNHTNANVPVRAEGPFSDRLSGTYENTHIYDVMAVAFGFEVPSPDASGND
ncbi:alkaline phosphatase [Candidatus Bipolaricaulota bacterium]